MKSNSKIPPPSQGIHFRAPARRSPGGITTEFNVQGMTCGNCARHASEAIQRVPGVGSVLVSLEKGSATVRWQAGAKPDVESLRQAVKRAGYQASVRGPNSWPAERKAWSPFAGWQLNVVAGSILTVPLLVLEWGFGAGMEGWYHWLAFALVLPIQTVCGARFYRGAWNQLKVGASNMDTLVVLGSTTAFLYSAWGTFAGWAGHLFFMESAAIITLISVGHWIESKVSARAEKSLRALLNLAPPTARLVMPDGGEREVPVSQLATGARVVLKPGDRIPTDGEVLEGASAVDESMLTGESMPIEKALGAPLYTGTINQNGRLVMQVTATGETTALAQIIAVVQRAQNSRAKIQKLGDHVSGVFVPIVVLIALVTALWWGVVPESARAVSDWLGIYLWKPHHPTGVLAAAIYHAAAVLIIACPCAMGLATPVAIMAGANVAAERGILIRDGMALEKTGRLTAVVFDKTGTLTEGKPAVVDHVEFKEGRWAASGWREIAAYLASPSLHPLSQAVAKLADGKVPASDWMEVRGSGVQAKLITKDQDGASAFPFETSAAGAASESAASTQHSIQLPSASVATKSVTLRLGSMNWLKHDGIDVSPAAAFIDQWSAQGATILGVAVQSELLAAVALRDVLKTHAAEVVRRLNEQAKHVYLITGDNRQTAAAIATQAGIAPDCVFAEVRPEAKAEIIQRLQRQGERVAFVGDGINDAPALEQADLGIAVSRASDVAREAADIILLNSDIHAVPEALDLAQATLRTIKQNLFWAFFYNAAGIPLAMLGFMSPALSALAMGLSDLIVIGNALRLRRLRSLPR